MGVAMKRILGDAKSQMNQNLYGILLALYSIFHIRPKLSHVAPPYELFIENAHEKFSLNLQLSTPCKDLTPHLTRDFEM